MAARAEALRRERVPFVHARVVRADRPAEEPGRADPVGMVTVVTVSNPCLAGGTLELFLEPVAPPPLLAVLGKAPVARAVTTGGLATGGCTARRPLAAEVPYVGLVASRTRDEAVVAELGVDAPVAALAHTPAPQYWSQGQ